MVDAVRNISTWLLFLYVYFTFYFAGVYTLHVVAFHGFMVAYVIYHYKLLLKLYSLNRHKVVIKVFLYILYLCILIFMYQYFSYSNFLQITPCFDSAGIIYIFVYTHVCV